MDLGIAIEGFFFEKVNGSTGQRVTFLDTILYMIVDDTMLSSLRPHHCKKHRAFFADSGRHHAEQSKTTPLQKHTASFARSTGKFPSIYNTDNHV